MRADFFVLICRLRYLKPKCQEKRNDFRFMHGVPGPLLQFNRFRGGLKNAKDFFKSDSALETFGVFFDEIQTQIQQVDENGLLKDTPTTCCGDYSQKS